MPGPARRALWLPRGRGGLGIGALAGLAGGALEVAWILLFERLAGEEAAIVARGVTQSVVPGFAGGNVAVTLGIAIHMTLAVALGIAVALLVSRLMPRIIGTAMEPLLVVGVLIGVWAVNFFVILPAINPDFVTLMPYGASLVSKVLFGVAAALVFWITRRLRLAVEQRL